MNFILKKNRENRYKDTVSALGKLLFSNRSFSKKLLLLPQIDYVIVHELAHLRNEPFFKILEEVENAMPEYQNTKNGCEATWQQNSFLMPYFSLSLPMKKKFCITLLLITLLLYYFYSLPI